MDGPSAQEVNDSLYFGNGQRSLEGKDRDRKVSEYAYFGFLIFLGLIALVVLIHCIISCIRNMCAQHDLNVLDRNARSVETDCRECYPKAFEPKPCPAPPMTFDPEAIFEEAKECDPCCEDFPEDRNVAQFIDEQRCERRVSFASGPPQKRYIPKFPSNCECGSPTEPEDFCGCDVQQIPSQESYDRLPACEPGCFFDFQLPTRIVDCLDDIDFTELREEGYPRRMGLPVEFEDFSQLTPRSCFSQPRICCNDFPSAQSACCCDDLVPPCMPIQGLCFEGIDRLGEPESFGPEFAPLLQLGCNSDDTVPIQPLCSCDELPPAQPNIHFQHCITE